MVGSGSISKDILESVKSVLGKRVKLGVRRLVNLETRPDRNEEKILAMSPYRGYILASRLPTRLESSFHYVDIQAIESKAPDQLLITCEARSYKITGEDIDTIVTHIAKSLKYVYPQHPLSRFIPRVELTPESRLTALKTADTSDNDAGPCGGFSRVYESMCDYYGMETRAEVSWDIDTIYLSHNCKELRLKDFDHLRPRDLIPIIASLAYNTWFTKINANNLRLNNEVATEVTKILEKNTKLEEIKLSNTGIRFDCVQKLFTSLNSNSASQVTSLDLSHNVIDDRGAMQLSATINKLPKGLTYLDITNCGISYKGLNKLVDTMNGKQTIMDNLTTLILADNSIKGEDIASVYKFLAQPTSLTHLDLSGTDLPLDMLSGAMVRGCCHTLTHLNLSRNPFTTKKARDASVPKSWQQLFTSFYTLQSVKLSGCKLPPDALKDMLSGISDNLNICDLDLDISSNELRTAGSKILEESVPRLKNVCSLNLSDNGFDADMVPILQAIEKNPNIKRLLIGQNFSGIKSRNLSDILENVVSLLQSDECCLEHLSLADSKLRTDTALVINSLSSNNSVNSLDISGNLMGNFGARMLSKVLQINKTLHTVNADRNSITAQGYEDIATSLRLNYTMKQFPMPVSDLVNAMKVDATRTQTAIQKIEKYLQRNHGPRKFTADSEFGLHQLFLVSPLQHIIGKLVVQIEGILKTLDTTDAKSDYTQVLGLTKEADSCRQLLSSLQQIAVKSQDGNPVQTKLKLFFNEIGTTLQSHLEETSEEMMKTAKAQCTVVMAAVNCDELGSDIDDKNRVEESFIKDLLDNISMAIFNKISEVNLSVAAHISDFVTDQLILSLKNTYSTLSYRQRQEKVVTALIKDVSGSQDSLENQDDLRKKRSLAERKKRPRSTFVHDHIDQTDSTLLDIKNFTSLNGLPDTQPSLPDITVTPSLTHLVKDRPKRPKVHATSRPMMKPLNIVNEEEINGDASDAEMAALGVGKTDRQLSFTGSETSQDSADLKKDKKRAMIPKIGGALGQGLSHGISNFFAKKKTTPKSEKTDETPKNEEVKKPTSFKKDDTVAKSATKTDDVTKTREDTTKLAVASSDVKADEETPAEEPIKRPMKPAIPKMGFGNDIMSQLKNRQAQRNSGEPVPQVSPKPSPKLATRSSVLDKPDIKAKPDVTDESKVKPIPKLRPTPPKRPGKISPKPSLTTATDTTDGTTDSDAHKQPSVKQSKDESHDPIKTRVSKTISPDAPDSTTATSPVAPARRRSNKGKSTADDVLSVSPTKLTFDTPIDKSNMSDISQSDSTDSALNQSERSSDSVASQSEMSPDFDMLKSIDAIMAGRRKSTDNSSDKCKDSDERKSSGSDRRVSVDSLLDNKSQVDRRKSSDSKKSSDSVDKLDDKKDEIIDDSKKVPLADEEDEVIFL